jgi:putative FmdB family regulatory protein
VLALPWPLTASGQKGNAYNLKLCITSLFQALFPDRSASTMPIYAYKCESCGYAKDILRKMSDEPLTVCPQCGESSFKKQLTAAGFQLKGSGWYVTDFRGGNNAAPGAKSGDGESAGTAGKGDGNGTNTKAAEGGVTATTTASAPAAATTPAPAAAAPTPVSKSSGDSSKTS